MKNLRYLFRKLRSEAVILYYISRDPRVPPKIKTFLGLMVLYVLSPIDIVPEFIPLIGFLDDIILIPLGFSALSRIIPGPIMYDAREKAERLTRKAKTWAGAALILAVWILLLVLGYYFLRA